MDMCTINMTFEVPETKGIDVEALRRHISAYFSFVISSPSVLKSETAFADDETERMLERFAGCWHGEESVDDIMSCINENKSIREPISF